MKMSEVGCSLKFAPLWAVDNSVPVPYKDGYLFMGTEGLYLLDSTYHQKRMLVKNVCHYVFCLHPFFNHQCESMKPRC